MSALKEHSNDGIDDNDDNDDASKVENGDECNGVAYMEDEVAI